MQVFLAKRKHDGKYYAVKVLQKKVILNRKEVTTLSSMTVILSIFIIPLLNHSIPISKNTSWQSATCCWRTWSTPSWLGFIIPSRPQTSCTSCWISSMEEKWVVSVLWITQLTQKWVTRSRKADNGSNTGNVYKTTLIKFLRAALQLVNPPPCVKVLLEITTSLKTALECDFLTVWSAFLKLPRVTDCVRVTNCSLYPGKSASWPSE